MRVCVYVLNQTPTATHGAAHAGKRFWFEQVLASEARVFFCKYNDPIYVKLEKLDIMVALASDKTTMAVLAELKEYAQEVDVDFVRKSVGCIGQVAIRLEAAAQRCVEALLELVQLRVSYVVQEAVVVIKVRPTPPRILHTHPPRVLGPLLVP